METKLQDSGTPSKIETLQDRWESFKVVCGISAAIVSAYLLSDALMDDKVDGRFFWDSREWRDFWKSSNSNSRNDISIPILDGWE